MRLIKKIPKGRYISPEERQKVIDNLRLIGSIITKNNNFLR